MKCYNKVNNKNCYLCCFNSMNNIFYRIFRNIYYHLLYNRS